MRLLDLFCGAGGAGMGYYRAGFEVVGVDHKPQKRYPFEFVQGDALEYAAQHGHKFDAIHASPPCQAHSRITPANSVHKHPDLIPDTRRVLGSLGLPYIIENVGGAPLQNAIMLCGSQFGLKVYRHRFFESNVYLMMPAHQPHRDNTPPAGHGVSDKGFISITSGGHGIPAHLLPVLQQIMERNQAYIDRAGHSRSYVSAKGFISVTGNGFGAGEYARFAMGIDWMTNKELSQAIPPAYTEYLGKQLMMYVQEKTA